MVGPVLYLEMLLGGRRGRQLAFRYIYAGWLVVQLAFLWFIYFLDYQVGQKSSWALDKTTLGPLLSASPDFNGRAEVIPNANSRILVARAKKSSYGQLTLAFLRNSSAPGGLEMYGWTAIDGQNRRTTVKLSATTFRCRTAPSPSPTRRRKRAGNSFILRLVHRRVRQAALDRVSIL